MARRIALLACFVVFLIGCAAPRTAERRFEFSRLAMGVEARIVLFAADEQAAVRAAQAAFAEIARLEAAFSDWRDDSELSQLAERAGCGPVPVSQDLFDVLWRAREVSEATDGAFDVTVGPLVRLWRAARRAGTLPAAAELARARALVGWGLVALDARARTVALAKPGMRLDLGGIGKGHAGQRAVDLLADLGHARALVQMGGDVVCGAPPPGRDGWQIDVDGRRVLVARRAVATSGDAAQHVVIDGVRYGHVVDPRTGLGAQGARQVTIEAADGATADALATAGALLARDQLGAVLDGLGARLLGGEPAAGQRSSAAHPEADPGAGP
ncbi:MAG: FAD:protein FMN transferase [Planctomycetes bacterium]|nr:FAD:protein FMN transferase [Planctomycetota bacterium]